MTKTMVDVQQVERHRADHRSRERTGAQTPDVSNLTNEWSVTIDRTI